MKRLLPLFIVLLLALLAGGCKRGPNVEGNWVAEGAGGGAVLELRKGGTFSMMGRDGFWSQNGDMVELTPNKTMGVSEAEQHSSDAIKLKIEGEGKTLVEEGGNGARYVRQ